MVEKPVLNPADYMGCVAVGYIAGAINSLVNAFYPKSIGSPVMGILTGAFLLGISLMIRSKGKKD